MTGQRQSPIDITPADVVHAVFDDLQFVNYDVKGITEITNLGVTSRLMLSDFTLYFANLVQLNGFDSWGSYRPYVIGGGLNYAYKLVQVHFHWSDVGDIGSEHTIEGKHFPLEIHFLHVKENKTVEEALLEPDGLMNVAVFGSVNNFLTYDQTHFSSISAGLELLRYSVNGSRVKLKVAAGDLLPQEKQSFFRYHGSLTTPDCNEAAIWTVLAAPIPITDYQVR